MMEKKNGIVRDEPSPDRYRNDTVDVISLLKEEDLQITEQQGNLVLTVSKLIAKRKLKRFTKVTDSMIRGAMRPSEKKKELAQRLKTSAGNFSTGIHARKITRNLALTLLFLQKEMPSASDAGHILMQLGHPGLFVTTAHSAENRRNWILRQILAYAEDHPCPVESWLEFANLSLYVLNLPPLNTAPCVTPLAEQLPLVPLFQRWNTTCPPPCVDFTAPRRYYLDTYRKVHDLDYHGGKTQAFYRLQQEANQIWEDTLPTPITGWDERTPRITDENIRNMFGASTNENSHVSREVLICVAIALGCTLAQTNGMLFDDNRALLYPNQSNLQEIRWVQALCKNEQSPLALLSQRNPL